jgi:hypothetical protein
MILDTRQRWNHILLGCLVWLWLEPVRCHSQTNPTFQPKESQRRWWAFQPWVSTQPPSVPSGGPSAQNPIDSFIRDKLMTAGIPWSAPADKRTWIRRVSFDLIGLPPERHEVEAFLLDDSPNAYSTVVDRLLASPRYGERWARHWLDVVRYADYFDANPKTRTASCELTEAWRYRDWVINAFNQDLPFDDFIVHQIAGDLLPSPTGEDFNAAGLIATTFLSNGVWDRGDADKEKIVSDMVDDQIDTIGKAFLGLTLGCARCHDHKFDPVSQEDYYALAGIFYSSHLLKDLGAKGGEYVVNRVPLAPKAMVTVWQAQKQQIDSVTQKLAALDKRTPKPGPDETERRELLDQKARLERERLPDPPLAMAIQEGGTPGGLFTNIQNVPIHIRGSYARLGEVVPRRLPRFFAGDRQSTIGPETSGRRELAEWIASTNTPLTARVIVNRVWQWHFGEGFTRTPGNLGLLSEPPTHPELLDWLAARLIEDGWSLKALHRRILLSETYQQSSRATAEHLELDPENRFLGRFSPRRLEAEIIRDALLAVSGHLDAAIGGPAEDDFTTPRRSIYVQTARWDRSSFANLFDAANPDASVDKRVVSTVAPQSLFFLNHPFLKHHAELLADRLLHEKPTDEDGRLERMFQLLYARSVRKEEQEILRALLLHRATPKDGWRDIAHVLLCSNEFVHVD